MWNQKVLHCKQTKKIGCFSADRFSSPCNTVFDEMGCFFFTFVPVKKYVLLSLKRISNTVEREESSMNEEELTSQEKDSLSFNFGSVIDGDCTRQLLMLNNKSEKISLTDGHRQINNS